MSAVTPHKRNSPLEESKDPCKDITYKVDSQMLRKNVLSPEETNQPFLSFMAGQLKKSLSLEIERFKVSQKKVFSFMF